MEPKPPDRRHMRLVPVRYHKSSGLLAARFYLIDAWQEPFRYVRDGTGRAAVRIRPAALCELGTPYGRATVLVYLHRHAALAEALLLIGELFSTGIRRQRYITLYKAYECIQRRPAPEFAAIRHALSHASSKLSNHRTLSSLRHLFGSAKLDLDNSAHLRVFYRQFVKLLVEVDQQIYGIVFPALKSFRLLETRRDAVHAACLRGIPGVEEPIPVRERRKRSPSNRPRLPTAKQQSLFDAARGRG
jgi:hypothetical protein